MIIWPGTCVSFESSATVEPRQRISNIYIYLYVSDQSMFIGSEFQILGGHALSSLNIMYVPLKFQVDSASNNILNQEVLTSTLFNLEVLD